MLCPGMLLQHIVWLVENFENAGFWKVISLLQSVDFSGPILDSLLSVTYLVVKIRFRK